MEYNNGKPFINQKNAIKTLNENQFDTAVRFVFAKYKKILEQTRKERKIKKNRSGWMSLTNNSP